MAGVRRGAFTCVGWQVTLCDPIWQVTSRSSEMGFPWRAILAFTFFMWHEVVNLRFGVVYKYKTAQRSLHVLDVVLVVGRNHVTFICCNACQAIVPALPVPDRHTSVVVSNCCHNNDGPIERQEEFTCRCRMLTDERIYRLPFWLGTIHSKELLHVVVAEKLMNTSTVNHLQQIDLALWHKFWNTRFIKPTGIARETESYVLSLWRQKSVFTLGALKIQKQTTVL